MAGDGLVVAQRPLRLAMRPLVGGLSLAERGILPTPLRPQPILRPPASQPFLAACVFRTAAAATATA